jgi:hypothetical protein
VKDVEDKYDVDLPTKLVIGGLCGLAAAIAGLSINVLTVGLLTVLLFWYVPNTYRVLWSKPDFWFLIAILFVGHANFMWHLLHGRMMNGLLTTLLLMTVEAFVMIVAIELVFPKQVQAEAARKRREHRASR